MPKPVVYIYVVPSKDSTKTLLSFIAKNLDRIQEKMKIKIIKVTSNNIADVRKAGIQHTPTMMINGKKYVDLDKIIQMLTPKETQQANFGRGFMSGEDMIQAYQNELINEGDEEDNDPDSPDNRSAQLQRGMEQFQRRRPQMSDEVGIRGGRKASSRADNVPSSYDDDESFIKASSAYKSHETPYEMGYDERDGDSILEDLRNEWADEAGRKQSTRARRQPGSSRR